MLILLIFMTELTINQALEVVETKKFIFSFFGGEVKVTKY